MDRFSFLNTLHPSELEEMYQKYLKYPDSIEPSWKSFFQGFDFATSEYGELEEITTSNTHSQNQNAGISSTQASATTGISEEEKKRLFKEYEVIQLIKAYQQRGHLFTKTNPVRNRREYLPTLDIQNFGLTEADLNERFNASTLIGMPAMETLSSILERLKLMYCDSIGTEYTYIRHPERIEWIQNWINKNANHPELSIEEKKNILKKLNQATSFENYLHTKFVGQKRFSLEGGESLVPGLYELVNHAAERGVEEFVMGMAHRGRLNVLTNIFGKPFHELFSEFESKDHEDSELHDGDVKYHMGSSLETTTQNGKKVRMNLMPNPSHLETVFPVAEGLSRAKLDLNYQGDESKVLPIIIHGDAAVAGQGVVYETVQMMKLAGYKTGGTIHIVVNNQIGFTTDYTDARSSTYCTDVGKVTLSPVLHVNSDDVEAVVHAMRFAVEYRTTFSRDVFIDLLGYRKYGHNEGDEPRFTQPILYKAIKSHSSPDQIYYNKLLAGKVVDEGYLKQITTDFKQELDNEFEKSKSITKNKLDPFLGDLFKDFEKPSLDELFQAVDTSYPKEKLIGLADQLNSHKENTTLLKKALRLLEARHKMVHETNALDWGTAETLAYATLLEEGYNIRISGEDVERGTFSHRHAVMKVVDSEEKITPLSLLTDRKGDFQIYNSLLSEYGVVGFDYGYSLASPNTLTVWEAQFGDFSNGAQIMYDQYISAAEDKWKIKSGMVSLLPHGYEGQGAEHSSARLERYLQQCAQFNMFVVNATTPANIYHLLRRQMKQPFRKPLIVFTPKSLLRHPLCTSPVEALSNGEFKVLYDDFNAKKKKVKRLVFCSGKFYYDLLERRNETPNEKVALVRLEQLYPLPMKEIDDLITTYKKDVEIIWAQEEPKNMGAWSHILRRLAHINFRNISPVSSAATAPGSSYRFKKIQSGLIDKVFDI